MAKFYPVKVADVYKETRDCSVVSLEIPDALKPDFKYSHGQHLTLKANIDGQEVRRSYSLCSSPVEDKWQVAVKKINGGLFSAFVNDSLKKGDTVEVMPPNGVFFTPVEPEKAKNYIVF